MIYLRLLGVMIGVERMTCRMAEFKKTLEVLVVLEQLSILTGGNTQTYRNNPAVC